MKNLFVEIKNERKTSRHLGGDEFVDVFFYNLTEDGESSPHSAFRFQHDSRGNVTVKERGENVQG